MCHSARPYRYASIPSADPPEAHADNIGSLLAYSNLANPEQSEVLIHHNHLYIPIESERYRNILRWLEARAEPPAPPMPPMGGMAMGMGMGGMMPMGGMPANGGEEGGDGVPCDALPQGDGIGNAGFRDAFANDINPLLVRDCNQFGRCHGTRGEGGGLWLLPVEDPCSADWNFIVTQHFINPRDLNASPILTKPLGFDSVDNTHGGAEVFAGTDDETYVAIRNWLIEGLQ